MKKVISLVIVLVLLALGGGCAQFDIYMRDRGNDLADCFTARIGTGYGLGIRAQATYFTGASIGISILESKSGYFGREFVEIDEGFWVGVPCAQIGGIILSAAGSFEEGFGEESPLLSVLTGFMSLLCTDFCSYEIEDTPPTGGRLLGITVLWPVKSYPVETPFLRHKFFFETGATLGVVSFDLGFNPVEFVDFLLGWTTLDITGDDTTVESELEEADKWLSLAVHHLRIAEKATDVKEQERNGRIVLTALEEAHLILDYLYDKRSRDYIYKRLQKVIELRSTARQFAFPHQSVKNDNK